MDRTRSMLELNSFLCCTDFKFAFVSIDIIIWNLDHIEQNIEQNYCWIIVKVIIIIVIIIATVVILWPCCFLMWHIRSPPPPPSMYEEMKHNQFSAHHNHWGYTTSWRRRGQENQGSSDGCGKFFSPCRPLSPTPHHNHIRSDRVWERIFIFSPLALISPLSTIPITLRGTLWLFWPVSLLS